MDHATGLIESKKPENKVTGFHVRILDDGTFLMRTSNKRYDMEKEYSYEDMESMHKGIKEMMSEIGGKEKSHHDALEKEKE